MYYAGGFTLTEPWRYYHQTRQVIAAVCRLLSAVGQPTCTVPFYPETLLCNQVILLLNIILAFFSCFIKPQSIPIFFFVRVPIRMKQMLNIR